MWHRRSELMMKGMYQAMKVRQTVHVGSQVPICVYDVAAKLNVDVRFDDLPSTEGMYYKSKPPLIVVTSRHHRSSGRQAYNTAHELGHHVFNHGTQVDNMLEDGSDRSEEFLTQGFAGFLLMPKTAVLHAFTIRGWVPTECTPEQVYVVSNIMGVGYTTLVDHMAYTLNVISNSQAKLLRRVQPKVIRSEILRFATNDELFVIDEHWPAQERSVDAQVGDYIQLPAGMQVEGTSVEFFEARSSGTIYRGRQPGISRFFHPETDWAVFVRVSRDNYAGWAKYRHLEDPDYE